MKILKLRACFGRLDGDALELSEGMNVIYAPNESGKSTWCAFIRSMLYGVDPTKRGKAGFKPDRQLYAPWDGKPMEGTMELLTGEERITAIRKSDSPRRPMGGFYALYADSGEAAPGFFGDSFGEQVTGVPEDVFRRTAFIGQSSLGVDSSPELEKRIASIVSAGEADVSYAEADALLRKWQRLRRYNKTGLLCEIEAEIDSRERMMDETADTARARDELRQRIALSEEELVRLSSQSQSRRAAQKAAELKELEEAGDDILKSERELAEAGKQAHQVHEALAKTPFGDVPPDKAEEQGQTAGARARALSETAGRRASFVWCIFAALALALLIAGAAYGKYAIMLVGAAFALAAVPLFFRERNARCAKAAAQSELEQLLALYGGDIAASLEAHRKLSEQLGSANRRRAEAEKRVIEAAKRKNGINESSLRRGDKDTLSACVDRAAAEIAAMREKLAMTEGELRSMGDPTVLGSEVALLKEEHAARTREYVALGLAIDALSEADSEMHSRFSPQLGRLTGILMSRLTGGRYEELSLDKSLSASLRLQGDTVGHDALFLSRGTLGQLWLSLRLALCFLVLPQDDPCPVILDDALAEFDDSRMSTALDMLCELAETRQIILFTCHRREQDYLASRKNVRITELKA